MCGIEKTGRDYSLAGGVCVCVCVCMCMCVFTYTYIYRCVTGDNETKLKR